MGKRSHRILYGAIGIAALLAAAALFVVKRPLPVHVAILEKNVSIAVFGLGTVEARILSKVGFEVAGALAGLDADHGDKVQAGMPLARLASAQQEARLTKAQAGVLKAEAALKVAEAGVARARAILAQKKVSSRRKQELRARNAVSTEAAEEAKTDEEVAAADLAVALGGLEVERAAVEDAKAQRGVEEAALDQHVLRAPFDAVVVKRHAEMGSVVRAGDPILTLVAADSIWALAYVDESRAGAIQTGQAVQVRLRSLPRETFQGRVARIDIESDRVSEERRVYVACERCPEAFHLGEQAEVVIHTASLAEALLVPERAVDGYDGARGTVWTVEDGKLRRRSIEFDGATLDSRLVVAGGLPPGARVVVSARGEMRDGRPATVAEDGPS